MEIYLATVEGIERSKVLHRMGYPYRLCSYYNIGKKKPTQMLEHSRDGSKWIMDSGLFSFMFGASKGELRTYDDFRSYAMRYVDAMLDLDWKHAIVECDAQRLLGVEDTYRLRQEVFEPSGLEVIYVWHVPDGVASFEPEYLHRKRIALSVPELRMLLANDSKSGGRRVKKAMLSLLDKCYGKGPQVHLLGNTETDLLRLPADSSDSSSWIYCVTFGKGTIYEGGRVRQVSTYSPKWRGWLEWCGKYRPDLFEGQSRHDQWLAASAISYELMINQTHGDDPWTLKSKPQPSAS